MQKPEHEFVELLLTVENGEVVACEHFSEGKQVEPLTEPMIMKVMGGSADPSVFGVVELKIRRALRKV